MNEDYLWDKTGSDSEIEDLEALFAPIRYRPSPPPQLRAEKSARFGWLMSLLTPTTGLLTAATLLFALGLVWQVSNLGEAEAPRAAITPTQPVKDTKPLAVNADPAPTEPEIASAKEIKPATALYVPRARPARPVPATAKVRRAKRNNGEITKEELKAYEQVMLALSIAGDKLKIVSEAANGTED